MKYASDFARVISPIDLEDFYGYIERRIDPNDDSVILQYDTYELDHRLRIYRGPLAQYISDHGRPTVHEIIFPDDSRLAVVQYDSATLLYLYNAHITECITVEGGDNRLDGIILINTQVDCPVHIGPDVIFKEVHYM